jgi:alpha-glucosidase
MNQDAPQPELEEGFWEKMFGNIIAQNLAHRAEYDAKYSKPSLPSVWHTAGAITQYEQDTVSSALWLQTQYAALELKRIGNTIYRVRLAPTPDAWQTWQPHFSYAVDEDPVGQPFSVTDDGSNISLGDLRISRQDAQIWFTDQHAIALSWADNGAVKLRLSIADEAFYATGERTFDINLRGRYLHLWNKDAGSYDRGLEPINFTMPVLVGASPSVNYALFVDNTYRGTLDIAAKDPSHVTFEFSGGELCFYLCLSEQNNVLEVVSDFTSLTGKMPLPPLWALGFHQSRYSYFSQEDVLAIAQEFRQRNIPCDVIHLDIHYMDAFKIFTWDKAKFPDFPRMIDELHALGFKVVVILDPGVKIEAGYSGYDTGMAQDVFIKYPDGRPAEGVVWPGLTHHPDFTNPHARAWWAEQLKPLIDAGVDGIWNDMNEPLYFAKAEAIEPPDYALQSKEGLGGTHQELHNVYGTQMARASRQALETYRPQRRIFNFTRSGYVGTQRYASSWTGDNKSTWDNLRLSIAMNLNLAFSGLSFTGPDVGGFALDTTPELIARWTQACALFPFFRNHSAIDTINQEVWRFDEATERICKQAIELRYRLMPYLYTQFALASRDALPIMRPIFTCEPENRTLYDIDDTFLLGDNLLVAPILYPHALRRLVYLPSSHSWYNHYTKQKYAGGQWISVEAPADTLPLFVREGSVIPMWKVQQSLDTVPSTVYLHYFGGSGSSSLYEDSGEGFAYQNGDYRWTTFTSFVKDGVQHLHQRSEGTPSSETSYVWVDLPATVRLTTE